MISFSELNLSLLPNFRTHLDSWLPGGTYAGEEYTVRNPRRDDKTPGSFKINVRTGGWCDFATGDKGGDPVALYAYINGLTNGKAAGELERLLPVPGSPPAQKTKGKRIYTELLWPCPADAPAPPTEIPVFINEAWVRNKISAIWLYLNQTGQLFGHIARYETPEGKQVVPFTLWKTSSHGLCWRQKSFPTPRPLFNLDKLAQNPGAVVVLVEGEKCAEIGQGIVESAGGARKIVFMTWPGGCKSVNKVDWSPLKDRDIILWPDADEPGRAAMQTIAGILRGLNSSIKLKIVNMPADKPQGWDVADFILNDGAGLPQVVGFIKQYAVLADVKPIKIKQPAQTTPTLAPTTGTPEPINLLKQAIDNHGEIALSEARIADMFVDKYGEKIRFNATTKNFMLFWHGRFVEDPKGLAQHYCIEVVRALFDQADKYYSFSKEKLVILKQIMKYENKHQLGGILAIAATNPVIARTEVNFDINPHVFNLKNGTLELKTRTFRAHRTADELTKISGASYDPAAKAPRWQAFLNRVFDGAADMIAFMQRAVGYTLTGDISGQCLFFLHGIGANGKSVFINVISRLLGDYTSQLPASSLMVKSQPGITNDIARIRGARLVVSSELSDGQRFDEALIKDMTGGQKISARFLYANSFDFFPTHKLWMTGNHKPAIRGIDEGIWRRIHLVEFSVIIPPEERKPLDLFVNELCEELPGILNWALDGFEAYTTEGLRPPQNVVEATKGYREEMDAVGVFLQEECDVNSGLQIQGMDLYKRYQTWCEANGEFVLKSRKFSDAMKERGFENYKSTGGMYHWRGLSLRNSTENEGF